MKNDVQIEVSDFGPIVSAEIDLKPLTVFVGPSNTGKSYLAILIYALHRYFTPNRYFHWPRLFDDPRKSYLNRQQINEITQQLRTIKTYFESESNREIELSREFARVLQTHVLQSADKVTEEINRCFGLTNPFSLIRKGTSKTARISLRHKLENDSGYLQHSLTLGNKVKFELSLPRDAKIQINGSRANHAIYDQLRSYLEMIESWNVGRITDRFTVNRLYSLLTELALPPSANITRSPAYYLPADRTGIMHAHNVVVSSLIAGVPTAGLRPVQRTSLFSGVLADFLEQLIQISPSDKRDGIKNGDFGTEIEQALLQGSVKVIKSNSIDYPTFAFQPNGWNEKLAFANVSSMISELAPMVLYLRHIVNRGSVLIIEEPESHLHPAMQVELIRQIASLVNLGIRVILTTHSEWLLEELANIVERSRLGESTTSRNADRSVSLRPEQVGAWLFNPLKRPRGSRVVEVQQDESGLFDSGYNRVAETLHNDWADLRSVTQSKT